MRTLGQLRVMSAIEVSQRRRLAAMRRSSITRAAIDTVRSAGAAPHSDSVRATGTWHLAHQFGTLAVIVALSVVIDSQQMLLRIEKGKGQKYR
jgi:hypothetical protein